MQSHLLLQMDLLETSFKGSTNILQFLLRIHNVLLIEVECSSFFIELKPKFTVYMTNATWLSVSLVDKEDTIAIKNNSNSYFFILKFLKKTSKNT